jgi:hypothetical protein
MNHASRPLICSPQNNPELFNYLCQRVTQKNVQQFSDAHIKGFRIEPVFRAEVEDLNESRRKSSSG